MTIFPLKIPIHLGWYSAQRGIGDAVEVAVRSVGGFRAYHSGASATETLTPTYWKKNKMEYANGLLPFIASYEMQVGERDVEISSGSFCMDWNEYKNKSANNGSQLKNLSARRNQLLSISQYLGQTLW